MSRTIQDQIAALDWHQQRALFRKENHERVIRVEGLRPDKHTGDTRGKDRLSAMSDWDNPSFVIPHDAGLDRELKDLNRDAELLSQSEGVRFPVEEGVVERTFTPRIGEKDISYMSDKEIDEWMQNHIESVK